MVGLGGLLGWELDLVVDQDNDAVVVIKGVEVLERLRHDVRTKLLPILMLPGSDKQKDVLRSEPLGANSYVRKSINLADIPDVVGRPEALPAHESFEHVDKLIEGLATLSPSRLQTLLPARA